MGGDTVFLYKTMLFLDSPQPAWYTFCEVTDMKDSMNINIDEILIIAEKTERAEFRFDCHSRPYDGFVYFIKGDGEFTVADTTLTLPVMDGMIFFFRRGDSYRFRVDAGCRYVTSAYRLSGPSLGAAYAPFPFGVLTSDKEALLIKRMLREWESRREASYMRSKIAILSLYTELFSEEKPPLDPRVSAAVDFIHRNFRRHFTGGELSAACSLSISHIRQKLREALGMSVTEYRDSLRIEAACEMLASGLFTPKETAADLGYSDVYHFTKVFTAKVGCTPARYAKKKSSRA